MHNLFLSLHLIHPLLPVLGKDICLLLAWDLLIILEPPINERLIDLLLERSDVHVVSEFIYELDSPLEIVQSRSELAHFGQI